MNDTAITGLEETWRAAGISRLGEVDIWR